VIERTLPVINRLGLHARASAKLAQLAGQFRASAVLRFRGREINAKSIMGLMTLAAARGSELTLRTDGPDEQALADALTDLFARRFDEDE
jgi:phosphocarrier protein